MGAFLTPPPVSIGAAGLAPKLPNDATKYLDGSGAYSVPSGGGTATAGLIIQEVDGSPIGTATVLVVPNGTLSYSGGTATYTPAGGGSGALVTHPMPLDAYSIAATYGDDFTGASLNARWTRRNVPTSETFQFGPQSTYMRSIFNGLNKGDGYYQTAPAGDWTFAMAFIARPSQLGFGLSVVDSSGTGVNAGFYNSPIALIVSDVTTYTTYGGTFDQCITLPSLPGNTETPRKMWIYLRKSSTSYFGAYSMDGEIWSDESPAHTWAGTVDRVGMAYSALVTPGAAQINDLDWFNKIA